jgi:hypothetical protein
VRVMPSGRRFFLVQYRRHGHTRRVMLGQFGIVTAELARREATIKLGSVRGANGDPAALRDAERQSTKMKRTGRALSEPIRPRSLQAIDAGGVSAFGRIVPRSVFCQAAFAQSSQLTSLSSTPLCRISPIRQTAPSRLTERIFRINL